MGVIVVKNSDNKEYCEQKRQVPMVLGMNIISPAIANEVNIASGIQSAMKQISSLVHTVAGVSTFIPAQSCVTVEATAKRTGTAR